VSYPLIARDRERALLADFVDDPRPGPALGIVWGRRRVGKSALLQALVAERGGFYHHAVRGSSAESLRDLAADLGEALGWPAAPALDSWAQAIELLLRVASDRPLPVVLDEFPYLLEHTPELDALIQRCFAPPGAPRASSQAPSQGPSQGPSQARLILCGSSISVMSRLLAGTAPLRGRAGLDLRVTPFDFRASRRLHGQEDLPTAVATFAVIGGVAAYARDMVMGDLPAHAGDFDRWMAARVLSPGSPLLREIDLLLSEDPTTAKTRKLNLYHATLGAVAKGHHSWSGITRYVNTGGSSLQAIMDTLVASELVTRLHDPLRANRPLYHPVDPFLRFHYAVIRRHPGFGRMDTDTAALWHRVGPTFRSQVLGPTFEWMARDWTERCAAPSTLGGTPDHVGPSVVTLPDGTTMQLDVVVAADDAYTDLADAPDRRTVRALGEAKVGETIGLSHLARLDMARDALGSRAATARLLLFGSRFNEALHTAVARRPDVELIDLERMYGGE
jgi:hypothetical protein